MKEKLITVGVALAVPDEMGNKVEEIKDEVSKSSAIRNIVPHEAFDVPHVTLYIACFPLVNLARVLAAIESVSQTSLRVTLSPESVNVKGKFVAVSFHKNSDVVGVHEKLVEALNALREGNIREKYRDQKGASFLSDKERDSLDAFGYPYAMSLFAPHMTLVALDDATKVDKIAKDISWNQEFVALKLLVFIAYSDGRKESYEYALNDEIN